MINGGIITCSSYIHPSSYDISATNKDFCLEAGDTSSLQKSLPINLVKATNPVVLSETNICNPRKRFTIVKTETIKPFRRGRWMCMDYFGDSPFEQTQQSGDGFRDGNITLKNVNLNLQIEIIQPTIYPPKIANENSFSPPNDGVIINSITLTPGELIRSVMDDATGYCADSLPASTPIVHSRQGSMDDTIVKTGIDLDIDKKIEESIELVKMHLVISVRKALEKLKRKVGRLTIRVNHLELENKILRANASEQTLAQLSFIATSNSTNLEQPQAGGK